MSNRRTPPDAGATGGTPDIEAGNYLGWMVTFAILGTYTNNDKEKRTCYFEVEIPEIQVEKGEELVPAKIGAMQTYSAGERANLRKMMEDWRGKKYDTYEEAQQSLFELKFIGMVGEWKVGFNKKNKPTIEGAAKARKGHALEGKTPYYAPNYNGWSIEDYETKEGADAGIKLLDVNNGIKAYIKKSKEYLALPSEADLAGAPPQETAPPATTTPASDDDDLPF